MATSHAFSSCWSLINDEAGVPFLKQLCPELLLEAKQAVAEDWPALADHLMEELSRRQPHLSRDQMREAMSRIAIQPKMADAVRVAVENVDATVMIVSDNIEEFIQSFLDHHNLAQFVSQIHANKSHWDSTVENRLRVEPNHAREEEPHGCELCPVNLCKGRVLDSLRKQTHYDIVLYVGGGIGDYCPATRLTSDDVVLARANDPDGKSYDLLEKIQANALSVHARVLPWRTGEDVFSHLVQLLGG